MTQLETWLREATWKLSKDSAAQVRTEIQEHYESARESALSRGAADEDADRFAVIALGDARAANRQYREVFLTAAEAKMLHEGNWEARAICSRTWLKGVLLAAPVAALGAAAALFFTGALEEARLLLAVGMMMSLLFAAPLLPVYTPGRSRVFRGIKWVVLTASLVLAFGPDAVKWSWLLISCLWPVAWIEGTRGSIRRKLRVEEWPKQLYL